MAKKFRSVLEKYDAKGNRNLPTVEEDAIERDTTLEGLLIGPGKAAASAIKNAINKKAQTRKFDTPEIGSSLPPSGLDPWKNVGFHKKPKEILAEQEARGNLSLMNKAAKRATEKGMRRGYGEMGAEIVDREIVNRKNTPKEKEPEGISGGFTFSETPSDFKKGGKVSASSRGDGIAKRGKTRGKMY
jgi:hypothetical protein